METKVRRYFELKQRQKEIEQELGELRQDIMNYCIDPSQGNWEIGQYRVKIVKQERREYDDQRLYEALPDPEVWKLISKADSSKISSLLKLNVISEDTLRETYTVKRISLLQVEKR